MFYIVIVSALIFVATASDISNPVPLDDVNEKPTSISGEFTSEASSFDQEPSTEESGETNDALDRLQAEDVTNTTDNSIHEIEHKSEEDTHMEHHVSPPNVRHSSINPTIPEKHSKHEPRSEVTDDEIEIKTAEDKKKKNCVRLPIVRSSSTNSNIQEPRCKNAPRRGSTDNEKAGMKSESQLATYFNPQVLHRQSQNNRINPPVARERYSSVESILGETNSYVSNDDSLNKDDNVAIWIRNDKEVYDAEVGEEASSSTILTNLQDNHVEERMVEIVIDGSKEQPGYGFIINNHQIVTVASNVFDERTRGLKSDNLEVVVKGNNIKVIQILKPRNDEDLTATQAILIVEHMAVFTDFALPNEPPSFNKTNILYYTLFTAMRSFFIQPAFNTDCKDKDSNKALEVILRRVPYVAALKKCTGYPIIQPGNPPELVGLVVEFEKNSMKVLRLSQPAMETEAYSAYSCLFESDDEHNRNQEQKGAALPSGHVSANLSKELGTSAGQSESTRSAAASRNIQRNPELHQEPNVVKVLIIATGPEGNHYKSIVGIWITSTYVMVAPSQIQDMVCKHCTLTILVVTRDRKVFPVRRILYKNYPSMLIIDDRGAMDTNVQFEICNTETDWSQTYIYTLALDRQNPDSFKIAKPKLNEVNEDTPPDSPNTIKLAMYMDLEQLPEKGACSVLVENQNGITSIRGFILNGGPEYTDYYNVIKVLLLNEKSTLGMVPIKATTKEQKRFISRFRNAPQNTPKVQISVDEVEQYILYIFNMVETSRNFIGVGCLLGKDIVVTTRALFKDIHPAKSYSPFILRKRGILNNSWFITKIVYKDGFAILNITGTLLESGYLNVLSSHHQKPVGSFVFVTSKNTDYDLMTTIDNTMLELSQNNSKCKTTGAKSNSVVVRFAQDVDISKIAVGAPIFKHDGHGPYLFGIVAEHPNLDKSSVLINLTTTAFTMYVHSLLYTSKDSRPGEGTTRE